MTDLITPTANPYDLFRDWMAQAEAQEPNDPNAMALATCDEQGMPSVRMVLLKAMDERGFVFYTNSDSRKGQEIEANPQAALCFHWKSLHRQVRVQGTVDRVDAAEADAYFATRHQGSQIGAWASQQSRELDERDTLARAVQDYKEQFSDQPDIPRPPHWNGYRITPQRIEFWADGAHRLHDRFVYDQANGEDWSVKRLYP